MGNKINRILRHSIALIVLLPLLVACDARPNDWQEWITGLVRGSAPADQDPAAPQALPTPTLAPGAQRIDGPDAPGEPPSQPQATLPPEPDAAATTQGLDDPSPATEPSEAETEAPDPFTGTFAGTIFGDEDSSAPLQLDLTQNGRQIQGTATLGKGLVVDAGGICGSFTIPALTLNADDELDRVDGRELSTTSTVEVNGFEVPVELRATLALDGQTLLAEATMYPPPLCGTDPTMSATLTRTGG